MFFKSKLIISIFVLCFFIPILQAAEVSLPLPQDAVKVSEKGPYLGPVKSIHKRYKSSWNKNKLASFYKKELLKSGWKEDKDNKMTFIRDNDIAMVAIDQYEDRSGKTGFTLSTSRMPESEEILSMRKEKPDKLSFMPLYPGSKQIHLWDFVNGVSVGYETENSIKEAVFFYKTGMLNYGWQLNKETPVKTTTVNCPDCKKLLPPNSIGKANATIGEEVDLVFYRGKNESCTIKLSGIVSASDSSPNKTNISVLYHEYKRNR